MPKPKHYYGSCPECRNPYNSVTVGIGFCKKCNLMICEICSIEDSGCISVPAKYYNHDKMEKF